LIQERTQAGLAAAGARGRTGEHPILTAAEVGVVLTEELHADECLEIDDTCKTLRILRSTFYRYDRL
jgi:DNA invertase Pin-like site-specific DNA recombinase